VSVKVLVVDDTEHVRNMLAEMLRLDGFDVVGEAESGAQAVEQATSRQPDVVVMDYKMTDMDGLEAARSIKERHPSQPIILYTAYMNAALEAEAKAAGVALCIGKVEGLNQLERHITELCRDVRPSH
jgi:CheY-like chemotaxis protein